MKNITLRNLLGGFSGGMLGILMFHLLNWSGLMLGCLVGVTVGWFHQEVWEKFCSFYDAISKIISSGHIGLPRKTWSEMCGVAAYKRFAANPKIGHALFYALSIVMAAVIFSFAWVPCFVFANYYHSGALTAGGILIPVVIVVVIVSAACFVVTCLENDSVRWHKFGQKLYGENSAILFWAKLTLLHVFLSSWFTLMILSLVAVVIAAFVAMVFYLIPWVPKMLFQKTGHWLCLGITLAVTSLVAWLWRPFLSDSVGLWLTALTAGVVSGGFSATAGYCLGRLVLSRSPKKVFKDVLNGDTWTDTLDKFFDVLWNALERRLGVPGVPKFMSR